MPDSFHQTGAFAKYLKILEELFKDESVFDAGKIDSPLLLLGLVYREVSRATEMEPGGDGKSPAHLINSLYGVKHLEKLRRFINSIDLPS